MIEFLRRDVSTSIWAGLLVLMTLGSVFFGFPAPLGIVFLGAVIGSLIAFISIGIVLIYRTNRIINFAGADIGSVAAVLSVLLVAQRQMNYFLAVGIGIAAAALLGALIEVSVIRRFFKAPRLILTVATIGLAQLLVFGQLILPQAFNTDFVSVSLPTPFQARFSIPDPRGVTHAIFFDANHIITILAVPVMIGLLGAFLRFTSAGVAARAVADNADRASLLGVPVKRISTIVWIVAGALSAFGALLRAPTIGLSITGNAFGPFLLVRALAPAVIGRMENLRATFVSAVALGVVDQAAFRWKSDESFQNLVLFVVILVTLLLQRRGEVSRGEELEASTWQSVREVRPIPRELRGVPEVRYGFRAAVGLLLVGLVGFGLFGSAFRVGLVSLIMIFAIIAVSLVILTGWAGQISLGQVAFAAIGAAVCGKLVADQSFPLPVALLIAGLVGAAVAIVIGLPALRIRGLFLAASTVAFALFISSVVLNPSFFGWLVPIGRFERPTMLGIDLASERSFYFVVLTVLLLVLGSVRSLRRSRTGRVLIGGRDNERSVRSFGVNLTAARLAAFALSGFYAALAGGLYAIQQNTVLATAFGVEKSLQAFVMVVIGGLGSVPGALLGATAFFSTQYFFSATVALLATGMGMLVLLMVVPGGLGQIMYGWRDGLLRWIAKRRGIVVPSLVADVQVEESVLLPGAQRVERVESLAVSGGSE